MEINHLDRKFQPQNEHKVLISCPFPEHNNTLQTPDDSSHKTPSPGGVGAPYIKLTQFIYVVKLTTHLLLVPLGATPPLLHTSSWRGALLIRNRENFTHFILLLFINSLLHSFIHSSHFFSFLPLPNKFVDDLNIPPTMLLNAAANPLLKSQ
jgi:hypothetical protein